MENTSFEAENMTGNTTHNTTMQQERFTNLKIFSFCISFAIFVVGLIGNGIVIFLTGCRMKTAVNSIWFLNLAVADFIYLFSSCIDLLLFLGQWKSRLMTYIYSITLSINLFASIFFLVVISLDRCLCTWMVVWAQNKRTLLRARIICIIVWVSSIGCTIPDYIFDHNNLYLITYEFTVAFLMPLLIIAASYIAIGVRIKHFKSRKQLRSYRVIITVILAFFICWFPYHVWCFYSVTAEKNDQYVINTFRIVSFYLVYLNSCLNPILYVFMCDEYKKKLKQSLLLVLETAFAEDHLDFSTYGSGRAGQENQTELLEM
ncbi:C3a anaphylatoxin chemotactic receptor-like isoform X2 [Labeo rohita]|uniref:C3a anaphylatoxin chemotactic receptor-like isoform X1 n=1 Tax=Labeo rohita TaxID=84645 RepID=UPI0021E29DB3|nr:C3a anaphylatoxin chemotactic receptor-like isoform X1 [Labeo rohita]XP_050986026.1 C3a anaphylatoxin chemotactic receptor-like isoform X2 [Labeo rohita]